MAATDSAIDSVLAAGVGGLLLDCLVCLLGGGPVASAAEAAQLAGVHDDLRHRGVPTTVVHVEGGAR